MASVQFRVEFNNIPNFVDELPTVAGEVKQKAAERIRDGAMMRSRVRSGKMRREWRAQPDPESNDWVVDNPTPYTIFNEYGTTRMSAQPMLTPAAEEERANYPEAMGDALGGLSTRLSQ